MMDNALVHMMDDLCYLFLALNALWGMFCAFIVWHRLRQLRFPTEETQAVFLQELEAPLKAGDFAAAEQVCEGDARALPQLAMLAFANRDLGLKKLRQFVVDYFQRNVLADLEYRISWIGTVIKSGPAAGTVRHGDGHDGRLRPHRHRRKDRALADRRRHQRGLDRHGHGPDHGHSLHVHAGQHQHPAAQAAGPRRLGPVARAGHSCRRPRPSARRSAMSETNQMATVPDEGPLPDSQAARSKTRTSTSPP